MHYFEGRGGNNKKGKSCKGTTSKLSEWGERLEVTGVKGHLIMAFKDRGVREGKRPPKQSDLIAKVKRNAVTENKSLSTSYTKIKQEFVEDLNAKRTSISKAAAQFANGNSAPGLRNSRYMQILDRSRFYFRTNTPEMEKEL
ncbi:hypothetical protein CDAR_116541 [Caerostris darwini]|uniref:Uncharacterized protein n=1 Tax=Caerostris darwini TaxID=1538125 RepID=A0AAV4UH32_9ARAC|nr:hypothetical protein CDAR_116541 [Caerostris darwini]